MNPNEPIQRVPGKQIGEKELCQHVDVGGAGDGGVDGSLTPRARYSRGVLAPDVAHQDTYPQDVAHNDEYSKQAASLGEQVDDINIDSPRVLGVNIEHEKRDVVKDVLNVMLPNSNEEGEGEGEGEGEEIPHEGENTNVSEQHDSSHVERSTPAVDRVVEHQDLHEEGEVQVQVGVVAGERINPHSLLDRAHELKQLSRKKLFFEYGSIDDDYVSRPTMTLLHVDSWEYEDGLKEVGVDVDDGDAPDAGGRERLIYGKSQSLSSLAAADVDGGEGLEPALMGGHSKSEPCPRGRRSTETQYTVPNEGSIPNEGIVLGPKMRKFAKLLEEEIRVSEYEKEFMNSPSIVKASMKDSDFKNALKTKKGRSLLFRELIKLDPMPDTEKRAKKHKEKKENKEKSEKKAPSNLSSSCLRISKQKMSSSSRNASSAASGVSYSNDDSSSKPHVVRGRKSRSYSPQLFVPSDVAGVCVERGSELFEHHSTHTPVSYGGLSFKQFLKEVSNNTDEEHIKQFHAALKAAKDRQRKKIKLKLHGHKEHKENADTSGDKEKTRKGERLSFSAPPRFFGGLQRQGCFLQEEEEEEESIPTAHNALELSSPSSGFRDMLLRRKKERAVKFNIDDAEVRRQKRALLLDRLVRGDGENDDMLSPVSELSGKYSQPTQSTRATFSVTDDPTTSHSASSPYSPCSLADRISSPMSNSVRASKNNHEFATKNRRISLIENSLAVSSRSSSSSASSGSVELLPSVQEEHVEFQNVCDRVVAAADYADDDVIDGIHASLPDRASIASPSSLDFKRKIRTEAHPTSSTSTTTTFPPSISNRENPTTETLFIRDSDNGTDPRLSFYPPSGKPGAPAGRFDRTHLHAEPPLHHTGDRDSDDSGNTPSSTFTLPASKLQHRPSTHLARSRRPGGIRPSSFLNLTSHGLPVPEYKDGNARRPTCKILT